MANLRVIRKRIRSVGETQKITRAMKMMAATRFRRAQERVQQARPYAETINRLLEELAASLPTDAHPLLTDRPVAKRLLVVFTSDRGLCGAFNSNLFRAAERDLLTGPPTSIVPIGKKAQLYFGRRKHPVHRNAGDFWVAFSHPKAAELAS
ncbi:MAG: FoF1 ATP synthase subunit gamma, partial [Pseudomonadota bacterium]